MNRKQFLKYTSSGLVCAAALPSLLYCDQGKKSSIKQNKPTKNFNPDVDVELNTETGKELAP